MNSPNLEHYFLYPGDENALTAFHLHDRAGENRWRLVSPICFEDLDAELCARMFRPDSAGAGKRADVLVNLTNDGWFLANENAQHLQAAMFRSIENRAPTARSVNTGISGFFDPLGHPVALLAARTAGTSVSRLWLCDRVTFFTRHGPVFGLTCVAVTLAIILLELARWMLMRANRRAVA